VATGICIFQRTNSELYGCSANCPSLSSLGNQPRKCGHRGFYQEEPDDFQVDSNATEAAAPSKTRDYPTGYEGHAVSEGTIVEPFPFSIAILRM
jgi:hypothetical protein